MKTTDWERARCPICRSEHCTKREIEPSLLEFVCAECTTFVINREILVEHLHGSLRKGDREIVSATIKHYFENNRNRIKIVLWHGNNAADGVTEKTISELKKEGKAIFRGLEVRSKTV